MASKKKKTLSWQGQLLLTTLVIAGVFFAPTTIILLCGMVPTIVAAYVDTSRERMRGITIGALNLTGCTPFIVQLWLTEHSVNNALGMLSDPFTWMVMYAAAAIGYCLEWMIVSTTTIFFNEKAKLRISSLEKQQAQLIERWGKEVTGTIPLDEFGFPIKDDSKADSDKKEPENASK